LSAIDDSTFARVVIAAPLGCPVAMWEAQTRLCGPIFRSGRADRRPEPQPYQLVSDSYANCKYGALCQSSATFRTRGWTAFSPACGTMAINAAPPPNIQRKRGSHWASAFKTCGIRKVGRRSRVWLAIHLASSA